MTTAPVQAEAMGPTPSGRIEAKLRGAFARQRLFVHLRGLGRCLIAAVLLLFATFLIDWLLLLPPAARVALLAIDGAVLIGVAWRDWLRHVRRYRPVHVALQVEREHPSLRSVLVSYVQLRESDGPRGSLASPALIRAVRRQAEQITGDLDFARIVDFGRLQKLLLLTMLAMAVTLAAVVHWTPHFRVLLIRMTHPGSMLGYPTRTQVDLDSITGDVTMQQGESITIGAVASGMVPQQGAIMVRGDDGGWETVSVGRGPENVFAHAFADVYQSFEYQWRIGDFRSPIYEVTVVPPPQIVEVRVDQQFPGYTNRTREQGDSLNMQVPEGTELTWRVRFDRPLRSVRMIEVPRFARTPDGAADPAAEPDLTETSLEDGGLVLVAHGRADASFNYRLAYTDADHGYAYDDGVQHYVHVTPDAPPEADLLSPRDMQQVGTLNKTLNLVYRLADDYGLRSVAIVYTVNDNEEQRLELGVFDNERIVEARHPWQVRNAIPGLKEGDTVTYALEARDNHDGGASPNVGRSVSQTLSIVSIAEYQRYMFERISKLGEELETVHEIEKEGSRAVEQLQESVERGASRP